MIDSVRRLGGRRQAPFGVDLTPLNTGTVALPYSLRNETNASAEYWVRLVEGAAKRLFMAGIGFTGWRGIPGMREALTKGAAAGCEIRILTMDAQNPTFVCMMNPNVSTTDLASQTRSLEEVRSWFRSAVAGAPNADVRALKSGALFQQIIIADGRALVSPYLYSANTGYSPCLEIDQSSKVFAAFAREFDEPWKANTAV